MPRDITTIRREHHEPFVQDQLDRYSALAANTRYGAIATMDEAGGVDAVLTSGTTLDGLVPIRVLVNQAGGKHD